MVESGTHRSVSLVRRIALRYLRSKRSEAFITILSYASILGVALGVMVLVIVLAIMSGFEHELRERLLGTNSHITVRSLSGPIRKWQDIEKRLAEVSEVISVSPYTYHQALIQFQDRSSGILIRGIQVADEEKNIGRFAVNPAAFSALEKDIAVEVVDPESGSPREALLPGLLVGEELVRTLGLVPDSTVSVFSPSVRPSPFGLMPRFRRFVVVGSYRSGLVEYENAIAYTALENAQKFFGLGDAISGFEVRVENPDRAPQVSERLMSTLKELDSHLYAQDWTEANRSLWEALQLEKTAYFFVLLLLVVLASVSIVSTLIMLVLEKRRDIAILKTLGVSSRQIGRIFRLQGMVIGGSGTVLGLLFGFSGCVLLQRYGFPLPEGIFPVSELPIRIDIGNFAVVGCSAFVICFLATIHPSRRAASLRPAELLRYE